MQYNRTLISGSKLSNLFSAESIILRKRTERYFYYALALTAVYVLLSRLSFGVSAALEICLFAAVWGVLISLMYFVLPQVFVPGQTHRSKQLILECAVIGAFFFLAVQYVTGAFIKNLAASPYDISPLGILYNLVRVIPPLAAREMIRAYSIGSFCKRKRKVVWIVLLTIVLFLSELNFRKLFQLNDLKTGVIYFAETVTPDLAQHVLLSVLVFFGGAGAGIAYAVIPQVCQFLSPILPNLPWIANSAVKICFPLIFLLPVSDLGSSAASGIVRREKDGTVGFFASLFAAVAFLWFCVGVFPIYPSVILTGSMEPLIHPGDVVLIEKITEEKEIYSLTEGEIINFKRDNITITHRIMAVMQDEAGNISFQTKGDNNDAADVEPVMPNDIKGKIKYTIPKAGLPILFLRSSEEMPEGVIDNAD